MFIKVHSTLHTSIGTFRAGVAYEFPKETAKLQAILEEHGKGDNPAIERVASKKDAEGFVIENLTASMTARLSLDQEEQRSDENDASVVQGELASAKGTISALTDEKTELEAKLSEALAQIDALNKVEVNDSEMNTDEKPASKKK